MSEFAGEEGLLGENGQFRRSGEEAEELRAQRVGRSWFGDDEEETPEGGS